MRYRIKRAAVSDKMHMTMAKNLNANQRKAQDKLQTLAMRKFNLHKWHRSRGCQARMNRMCTKRWDMPNTDPGASHASTGKGVRIVTFVGDARVDHCP
jgi:ribosomal protein L32E